VNDLYIVAGLGNPGSRYDNTRHNVGFETIDLLGKRLGIKINKLKHKALYAEGVIAGSRVILVKPQTFMNLSGESVREILNWYKVSVNNIIIVYDDIDLPVGKLRLRPKGSSGSHNGMKSVIYQIQSEEFPRVRIGIDRPPEGWDLANYVLSKFSADERKMMDEAISNASDAVEEIIRSGVDQAMNRFNKT
jgi:PTH1 family peptidyl-tRNA hydrolase